MKILALIYNIQSRDHKSKCDLESCGLSAYRCVNISHVQRIVLKGKKLKGFTVHQVVTDLNTFFKHLSLKLNNS